MRQNFNIMRDIDLTDVFKEAWYLFKQNWKFYCLTTALGMFLPMILVLILSRAINGAFSSEFPSSSMQSFLAFLMLPIYLVMLIYNVGLIKSALNTIKGIQPDVSGFLLDGNTYLKLFGAFCLIFLCSIFAFCLCILPILAVAYLATFVNYAIIDKPENTVMDSIKYSIKLATGQFRSVFVIVLLISLISSSVSSTLLGLIPVLPFSTLATAVLYLKAKNNEENENSQSITEIY